MSGDAELDAHAERIAAARRGSPCLEGTLEPELVDAIDADLQRLEPEIGLGPSDNFFWRFGFSVGHFRPERAVGA